MDKLFLKQECSHSLLIIFLGWGFQPESFSGIHKTGFNILLLSGYNGLSGADMDREIMQTIRSEWSEYDSDCFEVIVIGWSFGVKAASAFLDSTDIPVTLSLAVNGTEHHIDDSRGIPETVFKGTFDNLSERTFSKFRLRCAGSKDKLEELESKARTTPQKPLDDLREELRWFASVTPAPPERQHSIWDKAVIGMEDRIFPPLNQIASWKGHDIFTVEGMAHIPDFQWLIETFIVDKTKVCDKFNTAGSTYTENAVAQKATAQKLYDKFISVFENSKLKNSETYRASQMSVLELGCGDGTFTDLYIKSIIDHSRLVTLSDINISPDMKTFMSSSLAEKSDIIETIHDDAEYIGFVKANLAEESRDIILSSSMFQWLNSPRLMLTRCANALRHNGIIAFSYYGPGTFKEIQETVGTGLKYPSPAWMERIARECRLDIEAFETEEETLLFDSPVEALRHLKLTGVNALPETASPSRTRYLLGNWPLDKSGKAPLTFVPVYMILSKK